MKKLIFTIITVMCMLGFTACGNANSSPAPTGTTVQTEAVKQKTQAAKSDETIRTEKSDEDKKEPVQTDEQPQSNDQKKTLHLTRSLYISPQQAQQRV